MSVLTTDTDVPLDQALVVSGHPNLRKTHPNLWRSIMGLAVLNLALGVNFFAFTPTFFVWDQPNELWGSIFLALGISMIVFLNVYRRLRLVRITMALAVGYITFFGLGTMQPAFEGKGSLQLPLLYAGLVALQLPLLLEPFINPWTARRSP